VFLAEGIGHAFVALEDGTTISYLVSEPYAPAREHGINPLDPALALPWPQDIESLLSPKDTAAPSLAEAAESGLLPSYDECLAYYAHLQATAEVP
jgi:dTDP-4-dehydrorhamnose 3,5-epimerase